MTSREEYMAGKITHQEFYGRLVRDLGINWDKHPMLPRIVAALQSGDEHLNTIQLGWWDAQGAQFVRSSRVREVFKTHGDFPSIAGVCCVLKEAARQAAERVRV